MFATASRQNAVLPQTKALVGRNSAMAPTSKPRRSFAAALLRALAAFVV